MGRLATELANVLKGHSLETEAKSIKSGRARRNVQIDDMARTDLMILAVISSLCSFGTYAGSIASRLIVHYLTTTKLSKLKDIRQYALGPQPKRHANSNTLDPVLRRSNYRPA